MTPTSKDKLGLGDLFAPGSEYLTRSRANQVNGDSNVLQSAEEFLVSLADAYDVDASQVLSEFKSDSALGKLLRRMLNVDASQIDHFWMAIDVLEQVRAEGIKGQKAYDEAAHRVSQLRDPLGQRRMSITPGSLKTYETRARKVMKIFRISRLFYSGRFSPLRPKR